MWQRQRKKAWRSVRVLIIDEFSMLSAELLDWVDAHAREIRGCDKPFGGIALVLAGGALQLPPVPGQMRLDRTRPPPEDSAAYCATNIPLNVAELSALPFQSACFREARLRPVELTHVFRQEAGRLVRCLGAVRRGVVAPDSEAYRLFASELSRELPARIDGVEPTRLYARNRDVDATNASRLFLAHDSVRPVDDASDDALRADAFFGRRASGVLVERECAAPERLELAVGAQVMLTANLAPGLLIDGSRGVVVGSEAGVVLPTADSHSDADGMESGATEGAEGAKGASASGCRSCGRFWLQTARFFSTSAIVIGGAQGSAPTVRAS